MRTTCPGNNRIKGAVDEGNISDSADKTANCSVGLTGRELVSYRRYHTLRIHFGDSGGEITGVWTRRWDLLTGPDR